LSQQQHYYYKLLLN